MNAPDSPQLFVHHVFFYMPATATDADRAQLRAGLQKMQAIPAIKLAHIGTPAATDRPVIDRGYTYSWLCIFESAADELIYQEHPARRLSRRVRAVLGESRYLRFSRPNFLIFKNKLTYS